MLADKPATVVVLKPVGDGLVPGVVTPQRAKVSQQLPQPPPSFVSPAATTVAQPSQAAIIQKLLQGGAFVVGRLPNDNQPYLMPSGNVGLQPFQVVFGSAGAKPPAVAEPAMQRAVITSSSDGMSDEAAMAASNLLAEESREAAEKRVAADSAALTTFPTTGPSIAQTDSQPSVPPVDQVCCMPIRLNLGVFPICLRSLLAVGDNRSLG